MTDPLTEYERGSKRLLEALTTSCAGQAGFADQVRAALDAATGLLAAEPELARLLVLDPYDGSRALLRRHCLWLDRYAALLRGAAQQCPDASSSPPFLEPALLRGVRWQLAGLVLADRAASLPDLAPELYRFILCYYLDPNQLRTYTYQHGGSLT